MRSSNAPPGASYSQIHVFVSGPPPGYVDPAVAVALPPHMAAGGPENEAEPINVEQDGENDRP